MYIGLELCLGSLVQVVEGPNVTTHGAQYGLSIDRSVVASLDRLQLAHDFLSGIAHLHSLNIGWPLPAHQKERKREREKKEREKEEEEIKELV